MKKPGGLLLGCLLVFACARGPADSQSDAGDTDAGNTDAGNTDGGNTDAGDLDAGLTCHGGLCQTGALVCSSDAGTFAFPPTPPPPIAPVCDGGCALVADATAGASIDTHWHFEEPRPFGLTLTSAWLSDAGDFWALEPQLPSGSTVVHQDGAGWTLESGPPVSSIWGLSPGTLWGAGNGIWARLSGGWALQHAGSYVSIDGTSSNDIWAVGLTNAAHFDGTAWTDHDFASPYGSLNLSLVMAFAPDDVWAWGGGVVVPPCGTPSQCQGNTPIDRDVGFHFDGVSWTYATAGPFCFATNPGPLMFNRLQSAVSPVVVSPAQLPLYWDGAAWSLLAEVADSPSRLSSPTPAFQGRFWRRGPNDFVAPFPGSAQSLRRFDGVSWSVEEIANVQRLAFAGADHAWAVGSDLLEYTGGAWHQRGGNSGVNLLSAISRSPSGGLFALGDQIGEFSTGLIQRQDSDGHWAGIGVIPKSVSAPQPAVVAMQALAADDIWVLVASGILHSDGKTLSAPADAPKMLPVSIWAASQDEIWVGGFAGAGLATLARWTRQSGWTTVDTAGFDILQVNGTGPNDVWAAESDQTGATTAALRHWNGSAWTRVQPFPAASWTGVASLSSGAVFATGNLGTTQGDGATWSPSFDGPRGQLHAFKTGVVGDGLQAWFDGASQGRLGPSLVGTGAFVVAPDATIWALAGSGIGRRDP